MIQDEDPLFRHLPYLAPDRLRLIVAHAAGILAHRTTHAETGDVLDRISMEIRGQDPMCSMRGILAAVASRYGVTIEDLRGASRARCFAIPRHEAMWMIRELRLPDRSRRFSLPQIGVFLCRDHSTILHGIRAHERRLAAQRVAA